MISTDAFAVITNGDMSADITSAKILMKNAQMACVQVSWSGTSPVGSIELQQSIDDVHYNTIPGSVQGVSGNTGTGFYTLETVPAPYMKVHYSKTSGTGSLQASVAYKGDPAL